MSLNTALSSRENNGVFSLSKENKCSSLGSGCSFSNGFGIGDKLKVE